MRISGIKRREEKFSEGVRRNFEKFKEIVERKGKEMLVLGALGVGIGLGCASNGNNYVYVDPVQEAIDNLYVDRYSGCYTKEDSIAMTAVWWSRFTGSKDPLVWEELIKRDSIAYENRESFELFYLYDRMATAPYIDTLIQRAKDGKPLFQ